MFVLNITILPGHFWVLQVVAAKDEPTHFLPPLDGAGLLQFLFRVFDPVPQVLEHEL